MTPNAKKLRKRLMAIGFSRNEASGIIRFLSQLHPLRRRRYRHV